MKPNAEYERISQLFQEQKAIGISWSGIIYRSTSPRHATPAEILSGEGSAWRGGRWNPPGIKAIYGCLTPETAMAETLRHYRYYGIPVTDAMPRLFVAIKIHIQRSVDLTSINTLSNQGIPLGQSLDEDWRANNSRIEESLSQAIGRAAFSAGFEALIAPFSVNKEETNVVVYPDALLPGSTLKVMGL
jgi:RES domain-containing protein